MHRNIVMIHFISEAVE